MRTRKHRILVVERDTEPMRDLVARLRREPLVVQWVHDDESAHNVLDTVRVDAMVSALRAPRIDGLSLLLGALARDREACVVLLAEGGDLDRGIAAMRSGARDFQIGAVNPEKLLAVLQHGFTARAAAAALAEARQRLDREFGLAHLAGRSAAMHRVLEQAAQVAGTGAPILIEGEAGSGRRRLAQAIHQNGPRAAEPFVWVACNALSSEEAEDELFGHAGEVAGEDAEAGLAGGRMGRFERAEGGTLFLDEVGSLPATAQAALLRALHDRNFTPRGGSGPRRAAVRVIAAARDLEAEVAGGRFRADLCERLGVVRIRIPALRDRQDDLPALIAQLIAEINREQGRRVGGITRGALERLTAHAWPGNVRELRNVIEAMVASAEGRGPLAVSDLPPSLRGAAGFDERLGVKVGMTLGEVERRLIAATLEHAGADKRRAAALLGIGLRTLYRKVREFGLG